MTVSPLDQSKLKAPQSATNRGTPYTSSPEEMPTRLVASTKADGTKPSAHVVRPARVRQVHKQGMQGGLKDAPIKSPLASGKWDDEDQSEWTTSENQPSGKGTGLKHGAWRTSEMVRKQLKATSGHKSTVRPGSSDLAEYLEPEDLNGALINSIFLGKNILDESARDLDRMLSGNHQILYKQSSLSIQFDDNENPGSVMCRSFVVAILSADVENREPQLWHVDPYERRQDHQVEQRGNHPKRAPRSRNRNHSYMLSRNRRLTKTAGCAVHGLDRRVTSSDMYLNETQ
ncbi:hypothetical protein pipiens_011889 [Culex pipiens pipiens]|uniref:Uncharacterized protein n=1 Tax=Culex pipiens pipiens TaxID=38569 RepID=A0ABD1D5Y8_CULPP